ncbi:hypothetical protein [Longimicrobium sp.]|uniref:hypothetical protein n=1 Tax=Longimicrobium sp. TaxID=2029185 RepID=UPI002F93D4DF
MPIYPITIEGNADWNTVRIIGSGTWVRAAGQTISYTSDSGNSTSLEIGDTTVAFGQRQYSTGRKVVRLGLLTDASVLQVHTEHGGNGTLLRISSPVDSRENTQTGGATNPQDLTIHLSSASLAEARLEAEQEFERAELPALR